MPEPEAVTGLGQHAAARASSTAGIRSGTLRPSTTARSGTAKSMPSRAAARSTSRTGPAAKPEAVGDGRGQRVRRGSAGQLGGARFGDGQAGATGQRGQQLGEVERVARRPVGEPQQVAAGPAAGQRRHQLGHGRPGERGELDPGGVGGRSPQRQQVIPLRYRAHHPDQQQRHLLRRPGQPSPQRDAGLVGPLQVIDHQDGRLDGALLGDQGQQLLRQHRGHVRAAVGG